MFRNVIRQVSVFEIIVDRSIRQRSDLTFDSVLDLAASIARSQWISPILVDEETNCLIAGERRLTAVKALHAAMNGDYAQFKDEKTAREILYPICTCRVDSWQQWEKIPAQLGRGFTETEIAMYEFIENASRLDLSWQDRAKAIYSIHAKGVSQSKDWTAIQTAALIGVNHATVVESLRIWRVYADEDATPDVKKIIEESSTIRSAAQTVERYTSRRGGDVNLSSGGPTTPRPKSLYNKSGPPPGTAPITSPLSMEEDETSQLSDYLLNTDFTTWAPQCKEQFNFIHCDFPYGISFNTGEFTSQVKDTILGDYNDSSEVYWKLLHTLKDNRHIIAPECHIMFWFSQNFRRETEDFFTGMGGVVQPFLMVWHCGDGIVPDPQRYGRRTYETAMLVTFGDRKIVSPKALSLESSREASTRVHRSQKPTKVLEHFFSMFVDDSSTVLDPTVGSGTSLIVANGLGAKSILGLEIDPSIYKAACQHVNSVTNVRL